MSKENIIIPNLKWYTEKSFSLDIAPRCPFATVTKCPRFFQSRSLLGHAGSTKITPRLDKKLERYWKKTPYWPVTAEESTGIAGEPGKIEHFTMFCPEVIFERFGLFAINLFRYADEIDIEYAHGQLSTIKASREDWRWDWAHVAQLHYSECSLYSLLQTKDASGGNPQPILEIKPGMFGINFNLIEIIKRLLKKYHD